jgi:hypothetical protein
MFIHDDKFLHKLPTVTSTTHDTRGRVYTCDLSGNHPVAYPSITTILGTTKDKAPLENWRKRVGLAEAEKVTKRASKHGNAIHDKLERYLKNESVTSEGEMPKETMVFNQVTPYLDKHITKIYAQEAGLYSFGLGVAGRVDLVAAWDGVPSIIDFKTSLRAKKEEWILDYYLQATAYKIMWEEHTKLFIPQIIVLITAQDGTVQLFKKPADKYVTPLLTRVAKYKLDHTV